MNTPSPPPPIAAAMVAVPMVVTVATRMPARMVRAASGSSTCQSSCQLVSPIAMADSRTAGSTPRMPTSVLRRMGSSAYRISATIAVRFPIPPINGMGIRNPNSARLGMVCMTLAKPSSGVRRAARREISTPSGKPMAQAINIERPTRMRWSPVSSTISLAKPGRIR